jgi:dienelactone hydrolase
MTLKEQLVSYKDGEVACEGFFCYDPSRTGPLPAVLISHDWSGRGEFTARKARRLAWHGFAAFALDMYGGGKPSGRSSRPPVPIGNCMLTGERCTHLRIPMRTILRSARFTTHTPTAVRGMRCSVFLRKY